VVFTPTDTTNYTTVTSSVEVTVTQPTSTPEPTPSASVAPTKLTITSFVAKFPAGASSLTKDGKAAIKKIVNKSGKDATFTITGVAAKVTGVPDSRAKALAKARAEKVKAYLIKLGGTKSNISIKIKIVESEVIPKTMIIAKYLNK
jgi:outer membrane protein OmpA-like peptidoglycan-associated protein